MAATVVNSSTNFSSAGTQTPTIPVPTGGQAGDTLYAVLSYGGEATLTPPSGWTEFSGALYSTNGEYSFVRRAWVSGLTSAQWSLPTSATGYSKFEGAMVLVRGESAFTVGTVVNRSASSASTAVPGVTVATGGLALLLAGERTSSQTTATVPTGMTEEAKYVQGGGGGGSALIASLSTAGATGTKTVTYGVASTNGAGVMIAIAPTSGSVPVVSATTSTPNVSVNTAVTMTATETGATSRAWTQVSGPTPGPTIGGSTTTTATVTPTVPGVYTFRITSTNASGSATDDVIVTVTDTTVRPDGVIVNPGSFVPVNAADLPTAVNDQSDLTWAEATAANASITYSLPPVTAGTGYVINVRSKFSTTPAVPVRVELLMGSTVIKSTDLTVGTSASTQTITLTTSEVSAITNRTTLRLRVSKVG